MAQTVGVIGLGNMGRGIAKNIAQGGHRLLVWDAMADARDGLADLGQAATPADMAAQADVIIFVVPGSEQIESILPDILNAAKADLILWDFTTSDPTHTKQLAIQANEVGVGYMDAGMTGGGAKGADDGTMTLMIGGPVELFEASQPVLNSCAGELIYLGPSGAGHTMKVVHNLITHTNFLACSEAGQLAEAAGIDLADMIKVFNAGNARSFISERRFPDHILSETWDGRSRIFNLRKDVGMAVSLSKEVGSPMRIGHQTLAWIQAAVDAGMEEEDFTRMYPALGDLADK
ncbi:3-hydroxyisobutyrate dehydrogenase [Octadecabacter temperatus]|uniref:2-(Hydroxymethyl)glutarate dehydrogenase n=1 Tax=Octadecabacter temperatus TaxID=1458307 RepID=A0A0K0Y3A5_9RHOB|nr:NAD(P)-dependent oxidoreductase [Octadecabacter temperatus]AKS45361.1 2-(hydroxymethyl)glutarate dehydrogenase [Octadecabacter temperatus]SIN91290.1 3-hydroxyisobutyrate dehydrogenase [Octadecabacter temperatus]